MKKIIYLLFLLISINGVGQELSFNDKILLYVHGDLEELSYSGEAYIIDSLNQWYNIDTVENVGFIETIFFEITSSCINCNDCKLLLAYSELENRFFRLKGFKQNEFREFYNLVLIQEANTRNQRQVFKRFEISGYDLNTMFKKYYRNDRKSLLDDSSCYRRRIIRL